MKQEFRFKKSDAFGIIAKLGQLFDTLDADKWYVMTIDKERKKRSRNANNLLWNICERIALASGDVQETKDDVYRKAIRKVGVYKDFENLSESDASTLSVAWGRLGTGWIAEQLDFMPDGEHVILRCYYGSSTYNTKQFSRVLDYVIAEAENLGVYVESPAERALLLSEWEEHRERGAK